MAGRTSPQNLPYPKGMSRIFKQSVRGLGHKEKYANIAETSTSKPETNQVFKKPVCESKDVTSTQEASKQSSNECDKDNGKVVKTSEKKLASEDENKESDKKKIPCLFSIEVKDKPLDRVTGIGSRGPSTASSKRPRRARGSRYSSDRGSRQSSDRGWAKRSREVSDRNMNDNNVAETVVNHFSEDWLSDIEDPLSSNAPEYGPLQSTPKKQSESSSSNAKKKTDGVESQNSKSLMDDKENVGEVLTEEKTDKTNSAPRVNIQTCDNDCEMSANPGLKVSSENVNNNFGKVTTLHFDNRTHAEGKPAKGLSETDPAVIAFQHGKEKCQTESQIVTKEQSPTEYVIKDTQSGKDEFANNQCINETGSAASRSLAGKFGTVNNVTERHDFDTTVRRNESRTSVRTTPELKGGFGTFKEHLSPKFSPDFMSDMPPRFMRKSCSERESPKQRDYFGGKSRGTTKFSPRTRGGFGRISRYSPRYEPWHQRHSPNRSPYSCHEEEPYAKYHSKHQGFDTNEGRTNVMEEWVDTSDLIVPSTEDWSIEMRDEGLDNEVQDGKEEKIHRQVEGAENNVESGLTATAVNTEKCNEINNVVVSDLNNNVEFATAIDQDPTKSSSGTEDVKTADKINGDDAHIETVQECEEVADKPYLPPPPPTEDVKAFQELVGDCDSVNAEKAACTEKDLDEITECFEEKLCVKENESSNDKICIKENDQIQSKKTSTGRPTDLRKDVLIKYCPDSVSTSEADIYEQPIDDRDLKSTCSDYLVNQGEFDSPVAVAKSQEGSMESVHGSGEMKNFRNSSEIQAHYQGHLPYYNDDCANWWSTQQDALYWNWYYYMYMESYRHMVNWQRQQNNQFVDQQQLEWKYKSNRDSAVQFEDSLEVNNNKYRQENVQVMDDSLQPEVVAERTNEWVNSHMPGTMKRDPNRKSESSEIIDNEKGMKESQTLTKGKKEYIPSDRTKTSNVETGRNKRVVDNDTSAINGDRSQEGREEGVPPCSCAARDVMLMTWRSCRCSPPTIHSVHTMADLHSDLGYHSYESVLDPEDSSMLRKSGGSFDRSISPVNTQWKAGTMDTKWNQRKPYLYEQVMGNRMSPNPQHVYMLHSRSGQNQGAQPSTAAPTDNVSSRAQGGHAEQDENGNRIQNMPKPPPPPPGSLGALVQDINQNYRQASIDSPFSPSSGGIRDHFLAQKYQQSSSVNTQELSAPLTQSEAHLSEVNKTLSNAEKTNSQLGKSVSVMKDAIAAIKRYTEQAEAKNLMKSGETTVDINANKAVKSTESDNKLMTNRHIKHRDQEQCGFNLTKSESCKENLNTTPRKIFKAKRRERIMYESSCEPLSESSDDIYKDSMLSQSPSTYMKLDPEILAHPLMGNQRPQMNEKILPGYCNRGAERSDNVLGGEQMAAFQQNPRNCSLKQAAVTTSLSKSDEIKPASKLGHTYRGRGILHLPGRQKSPSPMDTQLVGNFGVSQTQDNVAPPRSGSGTNLRQPFQSHGNLSFNLPDQDKLGDLLSSRSATDVNKTASRESTVGTEKMKATRVARRRKSLVQYSDEDSSDDEDIQPFDVDSLSSDFNQGSNENIYRAVREQYRPKKLKHSTTSDDDSSSTPSFKNVVEIPKKEPVTFLKRPQRKLSHRHLKDLPSGDFPTVGFVKKKETSQTTPQKRQSQYPKTMAEFIALQKQEMVSRDREKTSNAAVMSANPPCGAIETPSVPPLPPLPPFPQSQFWSMYLPKYNSALTGKQDSTTPTLQQVDPNTPPASQVTPDMKRLAMRRSWGGAGCAIASPTVSDTESDKTPNNEWRISFRRFHNFGVKYIDTHCHLDFLFKREGFHGNLRDYMEKNHELFPDNFEGCVAIFCNPMTFNPRGGLWKEVAKEDNVWFAMGCHPKMATDFDEGKQTLFCGLWKEVAKEDNVWFAMGCHPKMATDFDEVSEDGLRECLKHEKCVALGEIGLDYSGTFQQHEEVQKEVFRKQLSIAIEMNKPLVIHCRDAEQDCLDILKEMVPKDYKIHCHCFTGYYYNAKLWLEAFPNLYIGVTPLVTYRTATPSHDLARKIPLNRLLLETDAPYFVPKSVPKDGLNFSSPGLAITVAKEIAQYQELPVAAVLRHCRLNTKFMYGI